MARTRSQKKAAKARRRALDLPELEPIPKRERNGRVSRKEKLRDMAAETLATRCRHAGIAPDAKNKRDMRSPWNGCHAGRAMAAQVSDHQTRLQLWDAIQHMRRVQAAYDRACGAPRRHAKCLALLAPTDVIEAGADSPPTDLRSPEEIDRQAVSAWMRLKGWLWLAGPDAVGCEAVVIDDAQCRDAAALVRVLCVVADGIKK